LTAERNQFCGLLNLLTRNRYIILLYAITWFADKVRSYITRINQNAKDIKEIKEMLNTEKRFMDVEKKLSVLEELQKNKKGQSGTMMMWIAIILLIILFYLYLRSLGILK